MFSMQHSEDRDLMEACMQVINSFHNLAGTTCCFEDNWREQIWKKIWAINKQTINNLKIKAIQWSIH